MADRKPAEKAAEPIRVRATALGIWNGVRMRPGAEFHVPTEQHVGSWMERLDAPAPAKSPE